MICKNSRIWLFVIILLFLIPISLAATEINGCGTLASNNVYIVNVSTLTSSNGDSCLGNFTFVENIYLDLNGSVITNSTNSISTGAVTFWHANNVTIVNGTLNSSRYGMTLFNASNFNISYVNSSYNSIDGFNFTNSIGVKLQSSTAGNNSRGIRIHGSNYTEVRQGNFYNNFNQGIFQTIGSNHTIINNNTLLLNTLGATNTEFIGAIGILNSYNYTVTNNIINHNGRSGINIQSTTTGLFGSDDVRSLIDTNTLNNNTDGIQLQGIFHTVSNNHALSNRRDGFASFRMASNSRNYNNTLTGNIWQSNTRYGMYFNQSLGNEAPWNTLIISDLSLNNNYGIFIENTNNVTVRGMTFQNNIMGQFYASNFSNVSIENIISITDTNTSNFDFSLASDSRLLGSLLTNVSTSFGRYLITNATNATIKSLSVSASGATSTTCALGTACVLVTQDSLVLNISTSFAGYIDATMYFLNNSVTDPQEVNMSFYNFTAPGWQRLGYFSYDNNAKIIRIQSNLNAGVYQTWAAVKYYVTGGNPFTGNTNDPRTQFITGILYLLSLVFGSLIGLVFLFAGIAWGTAQLSGKFKGNKRL